MHEIETAALGQGVLSPAARDLFDRQREHLWRRTDRMFAWLMAMEWLAAIGLALWLTPSTWIGQTSQTHGHVWAAFLLGGAIVSLPVYLAFTRPGCWLTRHAVAVGQLAMSALLIHLTGGRIETHFHIFGSLAFLAFYRDWRVLVTGSVAVVLDHLGRGVFWPQSIFGVLAADSRRWVEHAGWVAFFDVFLIRSCLRSTDEMKGLAEREARLGATNERLREEPTARERSEEDLRQSEERLRRLADALPGGVYQRRLSCDGLMRYEYLSRGVEDLYGLPADALLGDYAVGEALVHPDDLPLVRSTVRESATHLIPCDREYRVRQADGSDRWVRGRSIPEREPDGAVVWNGIMLDVTDRRQARSIPPGWRPSSSRPTTPSSARPSTAS